jgi:hypothetical protein
MTADRVNVFKLNEAQCRARVIADVKGGEGVVMRELHRAIIYTTEMNKQVTNSHVRDAVHMYPVS